MQAEPVGEGSYLGLGVCVLFQPVSGSRGTPAGAHRICCLFLPQALEALWEPWQSFTASQVS
jgi:hypothetical protein